MRSVDCNEPAYKIESNMTLDTCLGVCDDDSDCKGVAYDEVISECYLRDSVPCLDFISFYPLAVYGKIPVSGR